MTARGKERKRALDILFEADLRGVEPLRTLADWRARAEPPVGPYAAALVEGVVAHRAEIDALLAEHAVGWTLERMPAVDRTVLRIGAHEVLHRDDVPDAVAISEAVRLAGELSTDASAAFVNGLLGRLARLPRPADAPTPGGAHPPPP